MKIVLILVTLIMFSCTSSKKEAENNSTINKSDTIEIIRNFIYGLWSLDSGNTLSNEGYFFKPDGSVDFVAAEVSGSWELSSADSIKIIYTYNNRENSVVCKIDSLTESRMILTDKSGHSLLRKVPFGMTDEGTIAEGFTGRLEKGEHRDFSFIIPNAKKVSLKLTCENKDVVFNVFDDKKMISTLPLHEWMGIMVRGGEYKVDIFLPDKSKSKDESRFDLKVITF